MTQKIEDILDSCLERLFRGESLEDCLKSYPGQVSELEPLLKTSWAFIQKSAAIETDSGVKARVLSQLQKMLYARVEKAEKVKVPVWRRRWAMAIATVLIVFLAGIGIAAASTSSQPDEPLYPIKLATEQARLALTFSETGRAKLHIQFAERRAGEIAEMARQGRGYEIPVLTEQVVNQLGNAYGAGETKEITGSDRGPLAPPLPEGETSFGVEEAGTENLTLLLNESRVKILKISEEALERVPPGAKASLQQAIQNIEADYDEALLEIRSGSNP